ncbi:hypothetical protein [Hoeflea prorocentri]|uniref:Uncharacterized protein n=1 Tax=Hoeflea prorocentri TaxID=1922333 RepID=A0A9X3UHX5_9HYPH|nr:hypothetical protein [Hoeflea prorocentri]MCY6380979.1 hypothetical protein [Hoeflea prorocentri]MDA5398779.1 hypothetical protein [Hoeflea prorocentri]
MPIRKLVAGVLLVHLLMPSPSAHADIFCRLGNLFEEDLSHLVKDKIHWDKAAGTIDFTELGEEWREVCLTSISSGGYDVIDLSQLKFMEGLLGKEICRRDAQEIIALIYDHSGNALHLPLTDVLSVSGPQISTNYQSSGTPEGFGQCSYTSKAVARCLPIEAHRHSRCLYLFDE